MMYYWLRETAELAWMIGKLALGAIAIVGGVTVIVLLWKVILS